MQFNLYLDCTAEKTGVLLIRISEGTQSDEESVQSFYNVYNIWM
jgi:hypothetical protein